MDPAPFSTTAETGTRGCETPAAVPPESVTGGQPAFALVTQPELPAQDAPSTAPLTSGLIAPLGAQPLENAKHELFCEHVTGWGGSGDPVTGSEAYMTVYGIGNPATARVNASRLSARQDVKDRCAWMRSQLASSVLIDKAAVRAQLFKKRMDLVEKTIGTKNKEVALAAMRDIERSLGIDGPEVERSTVTEETTEKRAAAVAQIGQQVEAVAAQFAGQRVTVKTTINE